MVLVDTPQTCALLALFLCQLHCITVFKLCPVNTHTLQLRQSCTCYKRPQRIVVHRFGDITDEDKSPNAWINFPDEVQVFLHSVTVRHLTMLIGLRRRQKCPDWCRYIDVGPKCRRTQQVVPFPAHMSRRYSVFGAQKWKDVDLADIWQLTEWKLASFSVPWRYFLLKFGHSLPHKATGRTTSYNDKTCRVPLCRPHTSGDPPNLHIKLRNFK